MDFPQNKFKSNFLQKKKEEKKKVQEQTQIKHKTILVQKNIRAFLQRASVQSYAEANSDILTSLILSADLSAYPPHKLQEIRDNLLHQQSLIAKLYLKRLVLGCMKIGLWECIEIAFTTLQHHQQLIHKVVEDEKFIYYLEELLKDQKGSAILNLTIKELKETKKLKKINSSILLKTIFAQYQEDYLDIEGFKSMRISPGCAGIVFQELADRNSSNLLSMMNFSLIGHVILDMIELGCECMYFLLNCLRNLLIEDHAKLIEKLSEKNMNLLNLIEDEEDLEYFENKIKQQEEYLIFSEKSLAVLEKIFLNQNFSNIFQSHKARKELDYLINEMNKIYEPRKILFIQVMLSSDQTLQQSFKDHKPIFYQGLKMKLLTMDDSQFVKSPLFTDDQWKQIIQNGIKDAHQLTKKIIYQHMNPKSVNPKLKPFMKRDQNQLLIKTLSELLNNLYKKSMRTKRIPSEYFYLLELDKMLNTFNFGVGAKAIEKMLRNFPFAFRFQSRYNKLKEFIKMDKKNHDRSLFLQEEVDEDLIIPVRRGNQFMDAFQAAMNRDLRKKYKIIFYNEQGLQEEGIDGGGIIKQFINRVLKASFSENYGLFYENGKNQILPNPYCHMNQEYEFIGKIVGKAVYESINIQQKFAEPFLNLVIGRQNSFEDLQYVDEGIYKSLIQIKNMEGSVKDLHQTFVILDQLPTGIKKFINLKNPMVMPTEKDQILVTDQNKMQFIMSYADFKCNRQLQDKTRHFRKGFLKVMKSEWLSMFNNQELNMIISGGFADYSIDDFMYNVVYNGYNAKDSTIVMFWQILRQFSQEEKQLLLHFITSCPRPPTLGFAHMKPLICIDRSNEVGNLPTANTCMNVLRLPDYKNKQALRHKLVYAIRAKAGFQFA